MDPDRVECGTVAGSTALRVNVSSRDAGAAIAHGAWLKAIGARLGWLKQCSAAHHVFKITGGQAAASHAGAGEGSLKEGEESRLIRRANLNTGLVPSIWLSALAGGGQGAL